MKNPILEDQIQKRFIKKKKVGEENGKGGGKEVIRVHRSFSG